MSINQSNYRDFPAVSNSDLTWLEKYWMPEDERIDIEKAYANGNLIDAMITEPHKVDYYQRTVAGETYCYSTEDFERAQEMKKSFYRDKFCANLVSICSFQRISYKPSFTVEYGAMKFNIPAKAKWDLFCESADIGGDIKSTACTTQKQCEEAVRYFRYDRSRSFYMDLEGRSNDMLIFISKVNFKVFKIPVKRDSEIYKDGKAKYQELAFKWWYLFGDLTNNLITSKTAIDA